MPEWSRLRKRILKRIKPTQEEILETEIFLEELTTRLRRSLISSDILASVEVHGSASRGTWLKGERDLDIFIILPPSSGRTMLHRVNDTVKEMLGSGWVEAYAEHPYIKADVEGFNVEFIPCFKAEIGKPLESSVDRTPLHTAYLKARLKQDQIDEVMLLKRFMYGIGVYGAEIKVGGFSGYLAELFVLYYGSFERVLDSVSRWGEPPIIQFESRVEESILRKMFHEALIVIDPVDPERNVASAVKETVLWNFVAACRLFNEDPDMKFFFQRTRKVSTNMVLRSMKTKGLDLLFILLEDHNPQLPDTLWGQLYRAEEATTRALKDKDFSILRSASWSNERSSHILIFELETMILPKAKKMFGPPVAFHGESKRFIESHIHANDLLGGPGIEGNRWWIEVSRDHSDALSYLKYIIEGNESIGIPRSIERLAKESGRVLFNKEIKPYLNNGFSKFLLMFLNGRPAWLDE